MERKGIWAEAVQKITDEDLKEEVEHERSLLDKYSEDKFIDI